MMMTFERARDANNVTISFFSKIESFRPRGLKPPSSQEVPKDLNLI